MVKTKETVSKHYLSDLGKAYFNQRSVERMSFGRIFQTRYFRPFCSKDTVLLDFGCSDGLFLRNLPAKRRIGVDGSPFVVKECMRLSRETGIPIEVLESLDTVGENSCDVVISNHTLEHVINPIIVLRQMRRALRPGGRLVLVVPFDDFRSSKNRRWQPHDEKHHLFTWSPSNLGNLLTEAGFEVQECRICTSAWSPRFFWINRLFGLTTFKAACFVFSILMNRREVFCRAVNTRD